MSGFLKRCKRSVVPAPQEDGSTVTRIPTNSSTASSCSSTYYANDPYRAFGKHSNDPMRISERPDMVGQFHDPMSIGNKHSVLVGHDVTYTGA
jgi:hypothetical protein